MKSITSLFLLTIFISCSTATRKEASTPAGWNGFAGESYKSWDTGKLSSLDTHDHLVASCYQGKIEETLTKYKDSFDKKEENPYYWLHIGNCYFAKKDASKAEFYYNLSLAEAKTSQIKAMSHNNLGVLNISNEKWDAGKWHLDEAMKLHTDFRAPAFNLARLYLHFGHYAKSIKILTGPLWQQSQDIDVYLSLASAYLYSGDLQKAEDYLSKLPTDSLKREDVAATYALLLLKKNNPEGAKRIIANRGPGSSRESKKALYEIKKLVKERSPK